MTKDEWEEDRCARLMSVCLEQGFIACKMKSNPMIAHTLRVEILLLEAKKAMIIAEVYPEFPDGGIVCKPTFSEEIPKLFNNKTIKKDAKKSKKKTN